MKIQDAMQNYVSSDALLEIYAPLNVRILCALAWRCNILVHKTYVWIAQGCYVLRAICNAPSVFGPTLSCIQT